MDLNEVKPVLHIFWNDKLGQYSITVVLCVIVIFFVSFGFFTGLILITAYISGFFTFQALFKYRIEADNLLSYLTGHVKGNRNKKAKIVHSRSGCSVCGDGSCDRERVIHESQSWADLKIPRVVDSALADLLNKTLDEFVRSWYKDISDDENFVQEIRECIRYAASVVLSRGLKVDVAEVLTRKSVETAVKHITLCSEMMQGHQFDIHPAVKSREAELRYLRCLVTKLSPFILQHPQLHCRNFSVLVREILAGWLLLPLSDAVCDPIVLNSLLILLMGHQPLTQYHDVHKNDNVQFLNDFVTLNKPSNNLLALHPDMCTILKDQSLLYAFMQFLKGQGAVHVLQFCLDVEEFNRRMLTPDLNSEELDLLYRDAWDLYSVYFSPNSPDTLNFPEQLITQMRKVLSKDVTKLRTSPPLFQAYEYAYSLLDASYCPRFHSSDDFYNWLCGPRLASSTNRSGSRVGRRGQEMGIGTVARLSNKIHKIKGALKAQPVMEGQAFDVDQNVELETETEFAEALHFESERDLSAWRISITSVMSRVDPATNKVGYLFTINVQRIDVTQDDSSQWSVERKLADFYSLEAKLREFHGEFTDAQLPSRRMLAFSSPSTPQPNLKQVYEDYLQKLLAKPALRGSDLLFSFLACPGEFVAEDSAFGKLLRKSVPISLRKERGQNLEPFIATFIASTESKVKNSRIEWKDMSQEMSPRHLRNLCTSVFGNNFGLEDDDIGSSSPVIKVNGPTQCFMYIGMHMLHWSKSTLRLALALQAIMGRTIDAFLYFWTDRKLKQILVPQRIAHLIKLLQGSIFEARPNADRMQVTQILEQMIKETGGWKGTIYQALFVLLQYPPMNKQLFYCLLDTVIEELFPEVGNTDQLKDIYWANDGKGMQDTHNN